MYAGVCLDRDFADSRIEHFVLPQTLGRGTAGNKGGGVYLQAAGDEFYMTDGVVAGNEAQRSIDLNSKPDYREKLNEELREMRESEMWQTGAVVRKLRPENN